MEGGSRSGVEKKLSALVVDDDIMIRYIHMALLRRSDVEVEVEAAENGRAAVDLFQSGASFDLVLMDLEMPIMDGVEATKELREMGVKSKIVGVTADCPNSKKYNTFVEAGLDDCLLKPLTAEKIGSLLQQFKP